MKKKDIFLQTFWKEENKPAFYFEICGHLKIKKKNQKTPKHPVLLNEIVEEQMLLSNSRNITH